MRVPGIILVLLCCCALPAALHAQSDPARAVFHLDVQKSNVLPLGKSSLATRSGLVTYTNEFFGGKTNALKIQFDNSDGRKDRHAALVLFVDERDRIWQVDLTYVIPGTTVVRTVASTPAEVSRYFSDYRFGDNRLRLTSKGTHRTAPDSKDDEVVTLSWDTDLDLPVFDRTRK